MSDESPPSTPPAYAMEAGSAPGPGGIKGKTIHILDDFKTSTLELFPWTKAAKAKAALGPEEEPRISFFSGCCTLSKGMVNAGVFSLPYAWKLGGLWVSFACSIIVCLCNWWGDHILARTCLHLSRKLGFKSLDYGHFAKKVCETSDIPWLRRHPHFMVYVVNISVLIYQLGLGSVAILFIADNMVSLWGDHIGGSQNHQMIVFATITLGFVILTNSFTNIRVVAYIAIISTFFLFVGTVVIAQYTLRQHLHFSDLPAATNFKNTIMMIGIVAYAFEGQTMVLPVFNKLEHPEKFLRLPIGVLSITMVAAGIYCTFLGAVGFMGFGENVGSVITVNMPRSPLYTFVNICLMIQSVCGNGMAMYVIFDMWQNGFVTKMGRIIPCIKTRFGTMATILCFRIFWCLLTYGMVVLIPHIEDMMSLVGVTGGTTCALVFPPIFEIIVFWTEWKKELSPCARWSLIARNIFAVVVGFVFIGVGIYANMCTIIADFSAPDSTLADSTTNLTTTINYNF